jgi:hypothetical protein
MDDSFKSLLTLLLPECLLVYFTLSKHNFNEETLHIYLEEKNVIPGLMDKINAQFLCNDCYY